MNRVTEIDGIRGFALAGILVANIGFFANPGLSEVGMTVSLQQGPVAFLVNTLVLSKFYVIFSFLFGYSFTLQMRSAGDDTKARTVRRCLALLVLGVAHGLLLWIGDILTLYAVLGLLLLPMRDMAPRTAVKAGSWILGVWAVLWLALAGLAMLDPGQQAAPVATVSQTTFTDGPLGMLRFQLETYPSLAALVWVFQGPPAFAMFLFGLAAGKSRVLERPLPLGRIQWIGYGAGLPVAVLFGLTSGTEGAASVLALALTTLTAPLLAAAYVATLLRLPRLVRTIAPAGRMAASNYIGQSVLACLVFSGYGLGLAGRLPPIAVMGVAALIYATLLALSRRWLRSHQQGPVEMLLRRVTYAGSSSSRRPHAARSAPPK
ncbi:DUF418 domain-containing protein [Nonomuraea soli]|uniref:DUF418 domain-containing protein n=1 Tax=Nonomuraea soli TaxID=1032476 RepID=A0A7W0CKB9_9ACTN|nr:DUF418 domain-containing protein [Nonomuraea soli]MBA2892550.1 uncharacterized protein [Nonomuraea soli]